jgi:hypothetical protein
MLSNKDYSEMSLEELLAEQTKMKSGKITGAVFLGFLAGIAVYAAAHQKFLLTIMLLAAAFLIGRRHSQNLKNLETEISRRSADQ